MEAGGTVGSEHWGTEIRMRARLASAVAILLPTVGTLAWLIPAGDPSSAATEPACTAAGTQLSISASNKKFDKDCLAVPADQDFTIAFDNQDPGVPHNVAIYDSARGDKVLFKGEVIFGPSKVTYAVPAQPAGTYQFRCDPHDETMLGTFVVGNGRSSTPPEEPPASTTTTTGPLGLPL
jgi:plastocyanin